MVGSFLKLCSANLCLVYLIHLINSGEMPYYFWVRVKVLASYIKRMAKGSP